MNNELLIRDPVFQLNLLLWMAKEQPADSYRVRPYFFEHGFKIIYIEKPFPLPQETAVAAQESGLSISIAPEPELILGRNDDGKALYFEAKADSFSSASTNSKQARGHLLASGPAFQEVLAPLSSSLLCYVVPDDKRIAMFDCLTDLAQELSSTDSAELLPGPFSCHGLRINGPSLAYTWDPIFKNHVGATEDAVTILENLEEDTDPTPLVLVFSDEDCPNIVRPDLYRHAALDQLRARLLCELKTLSVNQEYTLAADDLLMETTDGVFQYLGRERQKGLRRLVRDNLFKRVRDYWKDKQRSISLEGNELNILWQSPEDRDGFLNWLEDRRFKFDTTLPVEPAMPLLDNLPDPDREQG